MTRAYYNDIDPFVCDWLEELIKDGQITDGDVDRRSIEDIDPSDLEGYTRVHFFAGIGGWDLALNWAGWPSDRQVWTGSCPCQPFSSAGKGKGTDDERHLWPAFHQLITECNPATVFGEQVASKSGRAWLAGVFADLEDLGYRRAGADICGASVGAPHIRQRLWWVADTQWDIKQRQEPRSGSARRMGRVQQSFPWDTDWQSALSCFRVVDDGVPRSVGGTDAARNAIIPQVAAEFVRSFMETENT